MHVMSYTMMGKTNQTSEIDYIFSTGNIFESLVKSVRANENVAICDIYKCKYLRDKICRNSPSALSFRDNHSIFFIESGKRRLKIL